jgi:hypothetical protein
MNLRTAPFIRAPKLKYKLYDDPYLVYLPTTFREKLSDRCDVILSFLLEASKLVSTIEHEGHHGNRYHRAAGLQRQSAANSRLDDKPAN